MSSLISLSLAFMSWFSWSTDFFTLKFYSFSSVISVSFNRISSSFRFIDSFRALIEEIFILESEV